MDAAVEVTVVQVGVMTEVEVAEEDAETRTEWRRTIRRGDS